MKRNGLVFIPREPPKRVILYPTQDSASQQLNGFPTRAKTALVTNNNNHNETIQQTNNTNNNVRLSRQQPLSSPPNSTAKLNERSDNDGTLPNTSGQTGQKVQNPYYANPFFRPKIVTNQQALSSFPTTNTNLPSSPPSRDSSTTTTTTLSAQTLTSVSTTIANRGRQPVSFKTPNLVVSSNGEAHESEPTVNTSPAQDDNRRWAHTIASAPMARRTVSDERPNGIFKSSETNITNPMNNNNTLKQKGTSATDIVISLMDTWRAPINPVSSSAINIFTRNTGIRDDSTITSQTLPTGDQLPNTPPFLTAGASAANNNNQNWKKALVANFQKNSRNIPAAKLFHSKQTTVPLQPPTSTNNEAPNQQQKSERSMMLNGHNNERTFQANEKTPSVSLIIRKSSENLRVTKQENSNMERAASLQIPSPTYSTPTPSTTINKTEENTQSIEVTNPENNTPQVPIPIPAALITAKPSVNVEQQRAIITRVMIRRDFAKSTETKPPVPNFRSFLPSQSAKPGGLSTNNVIQVATITENANVIHSNSNPHRIQPFQQQSIPLSQKSLLAYTSNTPPIKETFKTENNQQQLNGFTNDSFTSSSSMMKIQQSQTNTNNGVAFRSNSLSAANAESRRKKEELLNKKKRAISASAVSNDGSMR